MRHEAKRTQDVALTAQQERFAQLIASGQSQADAYRSAYPKSLNWGSATLYARASALAAESKVLIRVAELRKPVVEAAQMTLSDHLIELQRLKILAEKNENYAAAIKAEELRGKVSGLYVEKKEIGKPGDFNEDNETLRKRIKGRMVRLGLAKVVDINKGKRKVT